MFCKGLHMECRIPEADAAARIVLTKRLQKACRFTAMLQSRKNLLLLFLCLFAGITVAAQTQPAEIQLNHSNQLHFVAYGDTRFTDPADTKAANPEARRELVRGIANAHPAFVTFGGDIAY